jgi:hypothetical protein
MRSAVTGDLQEVVLVLGRRHARDRAHVRVADLTALHRSRDQITQSWRELDCCYQLSIEQTVFWRLGGPPKQAELRTPEVIEPASAPREVPSGPP